MNVVTDDYAEKHSVYLQQTPDITYAVFKFDTKIVILCQFIRIFEKKYMFFYYISNNFCTFATQTCKSDTKSVFRVKIGIYLHPEDSYVFRDDVFG